ncbi:MAG: DUF1611 domain-containing protein [Actinomycetota bacterium]|nr:DUF1611 domain-containing protein [Actinomycetota bacterium]
MTSLPLSPSRLQRGKRAFTTRYVRPEMMRQLLTGPARPEPGDVVFARVDRVGKHARMEQPDGRRATLFVGDEIIVAYGHRYATDQFEAHVPDSLERCHLVASGGVAAQVLSMHDTMSAPTDITPLGLVADADGRRLNLREWAVPNAPTVIRPPTVAVVGTAMNAGKTDAAAHLVRGLIAAGHSVGAAKITGTGSGNDPWLYTDAGANPVVDFTTAGYASTYLLRPDEVLEILQTLITHLAAAGCDAIVLEIADGVFQAETDALLGSQGFAEHVHSLVFAAGDALGAVAGVMRLRDLGLPVRAATGCLTCAPLAVREAQAALDVPVLTRSELTDPKIATQVAIPRPAPLMRTA